ncbi:hypothetical protein, partial [Hyphomicrobium sp.]|uniref:hypothetical protein n=1 Tax=Hyphomicrobium sp. TaxID=82 RepID=UPI0025BFCB2A
MTLLSSPGALAELPESAAVTPTSGTGVAEIQQRLEDVQGAADLDEEVRKSLTETYKGALLHLEQAAKEKAKADEYSRRRQEAPAATEAVREKIANPPSDPVVGGEIPLAKLEQMILEQR